MEAQGDKGSERIKGKQRQKQWKHEAVSLPLLMTTSPFFAMIESKSISCPRRAHQKLFPRGARMQHLAPCRNPVS